eukprot:symbB.v1.2.039724.t2/scaffold6748.1/size16979/1
MFLGTTFISGGGVQTTHLSWQWRTVCGGDWKHHPIDAQRGCIRLFGHLSPFGGKNAQAGLPPLPMDRKLRDPEHEQTFHDGRFVKTAPALQPEQDETEIHQDAEAGGSKFGCDEEPQAVFHPKDLPPHQTPLNIMTMQTQAFWMLLPLVGAARAAREARSDLGLGTLDLERPQLQQMNLNNLQHVVNSAAAGEMLVWRRLTGQSTQDLWTSGLEGYDVSKTLDAYQIDSALKLRKAVGAAMEYECFSAVLDPLHRCHKAFPIYDFLITMTFLTLIASGLCACFIPKKRSTPSFLET